MFGPSSALLNTFITFLTGYDAYKRFPFKGYPHYFFRSSIMSDIPNGVELQAGPSIGTKGLSYAFPDGSSGLQAVTLDLPPGSRTLLIGGELPLSSIRFLVST